MESRPHGSPSECWSHSAAGERQCRLLCPMGTFSVGNMKTCHPWLTCDDFKQFKVLRTLGEGAVKQVYLVEWRDTRLVVSTLRRTDYAADFAHGLDMLRRLQPDPGSHGSDADVDGLRGGSSVQRRFVTQLVGACEASASYATEYHPLGTAEHAVTLAGRLDSPRSASLAILQLCLSYARLLEFLHGGNGVVGVVVMCDANDLLKLLSQLLLRDDLSVVANDLDATPIVGGGGISSSGGGSGGNSSRDTVKCGHRQLFGDFVAPEQLWPYGEDEPFEDARMPGYTEKVDIYKAPDVCTHFLQAVPEAHRLALTYRLFGIHRRCKSVRPQARPTAVELRLAYEGEFAAYLENPAVALQST